MSSIPDVSTYQHDTHSVKSKPEHTAHKPEHEPTVYNFEPLQFHTQYPETENTENIAIKTKTTPTTDKSTNNEHGYRDVLNIDTKIMDSAKSMVLSPGSMSVQKQRLMHFAKILNEESVKLNEEKRIQQQNIAISEQKLVLQNELKDIQQRTKKFESMMEDQKLRLNEKRI